MINFKKFKLNNGLKVIIHEDLTTPMVVVNTLYDVGSRDEDPEGTGFAHLFEHLMFGGSINVKRFDREVEKAGGYSNAFTSNDITNYYEVIPAKNIESALWLESDRMLQLDFSAKRLSNQQNVVIEEFKQRCLNQPYGDVWLKILPLAYKKHPYRWDTIGKDISHIENATLPDVKDFFFKHYRPNHAILSIAGNVNTMSALRLVEKWYSNIPKDLAYKRDLTKEPKQKKLRTLKVKADVPLNAIFMAFHMDSRPSKNYYAQDLITDCLSRGKSSRLYQRLVKEKKLFSAISAFSTGSIDPGLIVISGYIINGVSMREAETAIWEELERLKSDLTEKELQKSKNQVTSSFEFDLIDLSQRALSLAYYELLGDASQVNLEVGKYQKVTREAVMSQAKNIFIKENCSILYYHTQD